MPVDFEEYWRKLKETNPQLEDSSRVSLRIEEFRRHLLLAFERGVISGTESASLFERIFGK